MKKMLFSIFSVVCALCLLCACAPESVPEASPSPEAEATATATVAPEESPAETEEARLDTMLASASVTETIQQHIDASRSASGEPDAAYDEALFLAAQGAALDMAAMGVVSEENPGYSGYYSVAVSATTPNDELASYVLDALPALLSGDGKIGIGAATSAPDGIKTIFLVIYLD